MSVLSRRCRDQYSSTFAIRSKIFLVSRFLEIVQVEKCVSGTNTVP